MSNSDFRQAIDAAEDLKISGKHRQAIKACEEILAEDPECVHAYEEIGDNYISLRQIDKAEKALLYALKLDKKSANAHYLLGFMYSCDRRWAESVRHLEQADTLRPNHPEVLRCLGWSIYSIGEKQRGLIILERARAMSPDDVFILTDLGVCYLTERETEKALPIFRRILELDPDNVKAKECLMIVEDFVRASRKLRRPRPKSE